MKVKSKIRSNNRVLIFYNSNKGQCSSFFSNSHYIFWTSVHVFLSLDFFSNNRLIVDIDNDYFKNFRCLKLKHDYKQMMSQL